MKKLIEIIHVNNLKIHFLVVLGFIVLSSLFYYPIFLGKSIVQSDISQYMGMSRQIEEHRSTYEKETYWIDNAFGGMPTYQLGAKYPYDILTPIHKIFRLLPHPIFLLFLYFFSFYFFLVTIKIPVKYSVFGALAYGLSTYLLIIIQVGHNTKAQALGYFPLVLAGVIMIFQNRYKWGLLLSVIAMGLQIRANHYQMSYYLILLLIPLFIIKFKEYFINNNLKQFWKQSCVIIFSGLLAIGLNFTAIISTAEYSKFSTRGKSEISLTEEGSQILASSGLEYDYITQFSYGIYESLNLIIPRIQGGASRENLGKSSELFKHLITNGISRAQAEQFIENVPTYWGSQPILEAPAYIGVSVVFLAILSLILSITPLKKWLLLGSVFSLLLSWGKNFSLLTSFFIDYVPLYNKFRAVSSIQVLLEFCIPVLATFGLYEFMSTENILKRKKLIKTILIFSILFIIIFFTKYFNSFDGVNDAYFSQIYGNEILSQIKDARISLFNDDVIRSFVIVSLISILLLYFLKNSKKNKLVLFLLYCILIIDLVGISSRYINRNLFISKAKINQVFSITKADASILKDKDRFRVYEPSIGLNGSRTSYFHNSIGGYHGAKPRRYEELYSLFVSNEIGGVIDMLNVKYLLYRDKDNLLKSMKNHNALGNAWFVENLQKMESVDSVYYAMKNIDFSISAITNSNKSTLLPDKYKIDSLSSIKLVDYKAGYLKYNFSSLEDSFIVFSEIYYPHGWKVLVDGKPSNHFDVNYILRGMYIAKGIHVIEYKFEPDIIKLGSLVQIGSITIFSILLLISIAISLKKRKLINN